MKIKKELDKIPFEQGNKDRIFSKVEEKIKSRQMKTDEYENIAADATKILQISDDNVKKHKFKKTILKIACVNIAALIIIVSIFGFNLGNVQNTFTAYVPKFIECYMSRVNTSKPLASKSHMSTSLSRSGADLELVILVENKQKDSIMSVTVWDSHLDAEVVFTQDSQKYRIISSEMEKENGVYITTIILGIPLSTTDTARTLDIREIKYFRKRLIGSDLSGAVTIPDKTKAQVTFTINQLSSILGRDDFCKTD